MGKRAFRGWGGAGLATAVLSAAGLAGVTGVSLAAGSGEGTETISQTWIVTIGGMETKLPHENSKVTYCTNATVNSITPHFVITDSTGGHHYYAYHILNPANERSLNTYAGFSGTMTEGGNAYNPESWSRASERQTNPKFATGEYRLEVAPNGQFAKGGTTTRFEKWGELILVGKPPTEKC